VWPETKSRAELELSLLRRELEEYRDLIEKVHQAEPSKIELAALAAFVHAYYTGIESIFKRIATEVDGDSSDGGRWHSDLLRSMAQPTEKRKAVVSIGLRHVLGKYLEFRHVFRHAYNFELKWSRMGDLVLDAEEVLNRLEAELRSFFSGDAPDEAS